MGRAASPVGYTNSLLTQIRDLRDEAQLIGSSALEGLSKDASSSHSHSITWQQKCPDSDVKRWLTANQSVFSQQINTTLKIS